MNFKDKFDNSFYDLFVAKNDDPFVDKSDFIADLNKCVNFTQKKFLAVTRPRRFAKTVTADMLELYYSNKYDSKEIFSTLKISQDQSFLEHLNKYNVIFLDMNDIEAILKEKSRNPIFKDDFVDVLCYETILKLKENKEFKKIISKNPSIDDYSLRSAIVEINAKIKEKFIVLIDEWDLIFRDFRDDFDLQFKFVDLLKNLFKAKNLGSCFALVYMTGILPIKKYYSHSFLNNFKEYNMLRPQKFAKYFGFLTMM